TLISMRTLAIAAVLLLGAFAARAQTLGELTAATGINNSLDANAANSAASARGTIVHKLQSIGASSGTSGKGWEDASEGSHTAHAATSVGARGARGGAWASPHSGQQSNPGAHGGSGPVPPRR